MSRNRFEAISAFLHVVSEREESANKHHPLRKILSLSNHMKEKCFELYQPLRELSVDERMVKSKARTHLRQYIRNKPTKWGFKFWVLADPTGYTVDFNVYCAGRGTPRTPHGLGFDVVTNLVRPFQQQGYYLFIDNFYTSPALVQKLEEVDIRTTGTLQTNRRNVPEEVQQLQAALKSTQVPRGTGYYIRQPGSSCVYVCWHDKEVVTLMSNAYPGHQDGTVKRRSKDSAGASVSLDVPLPAVVKNYNTFMGGVDKSDQLISYHRVIRQTKRYWKTLFYHFVEIAVTNSFVLQKLVLLKHGQKTCTESYFRDQLVHQVIQQYGVQSPSPSTSLIIGYRTLHGSKAFEYSQRSRCAVCKVKTTRRCPDCPFTPALCQTATKDCHSIWHSEQHDCLRSAWFVNKRARTTSHRAMHSTQTVSSATVSHGSSLKRRPGRPKGSGDKRKKKKH